MFVFNPRACTCSSYAAKLAPYLWPQTLPHHSNNCYPNCSNRYLINNQYPSFWFSGWFKRSIQNYPESPEVGISRQGVKYACFSFIRCTIYLSLSYPQCISGKYLMMSIVLHLVVSSGQLFFPDNIQLVSYDFVIIDACRSLWWRRTSKVP